MMMRVFSLLLATLLLGLCGAALPPVHQEKQKTGEANKPAIPLNEQEAIIKDVLQSWDRQYNEFESYSFDVSITEKDPAFKREIKAAAKVLMLKRPNGNIWVKLNELDKDGKPTSTVILRDRQIIFMNHQSKHLAVLKADTLLNKQGVADISESIFSSVPFFQTDEVDLRKKYTLSIVQKDEDYTWIKYTPVTGRSSWFTSVGLIAVINYKNIVSPKHFPLRIAWLEPGRKEITWNFTRVDINYPFTVVESDFYPDYSQLKEKGWRSSASSMKSSIEFLKKLFKTPQLQFSL